VRLTVSILQTPGVLKDGLRVESGFLDDEERVDAPVPLTRMDHVVGFIALVGAILGIILVVWSFIAVAAAAILWTPGLVQ
jgi:hypothetical protein